MGTNSNDLISSIKLRGSFPTSNDLFSNADYLQILNDELLNSIVPIINKVNEEYFLTYKDQLITSGVDTYRIPQRSVAGMLRDVQWVSSSGSVVPLQRLFEEDRTSTTTGPLGYYLKGYNLILSPIPTTSTDTLRMAYIRRPSKLVLPTACAQVTNINGNIITVSALPSTMTNGISVDFVQSQAPYDILSMDTTISSVSGTTLTFTTVPTDLAVGDYICLAGESCVPGCPEELVSLLVQSALCVCLTSKKDSSAQLELQKLQQMKDSALGLLTPRVKSNDVKIKNINGLLGFIRGY